MERGFVTHKLTKKHIQWYRNKMNVALAAQLLSKSIADSMDFLRKQNCDDFMDSEPTSKFVHIVDSLFNIFNSNSTKSTNQFKNALNKQSAGAVFTFLEKTSDYLKALQIRGKNILDTRKRTGFKGFLINIINLKSIYDLLVEPGLTENLNTYNMSQDPLELLFGRIRTLNGNNDNPTVNQFTSAFRKIQIKNEITASKLANCEDKLRILTVSSRRQLQCMKENINFDATKATPAELEEFEQLEINEEELEDAFENSLNTNDFLLDCGEEASIARIGGFVETNILEIGRFECDCKHVLLRNEKVNEFTLTANNSIPCISTVYVCKIANACFNKYRNQILFNYEKLIEKIMATIHLNNVFTQESHKKGFVLYIVMEFIRLQATYIAKNLTLIEQKILCRKHLNKKIHFLGQ